MNRTDWQRLAERWLLDAKQLLDGQRWSAAYYVTGYAVECGLKACVLVRLAAAPELIFEQKKFSENCWTHNVLDLLKLADLQAARLADAKANPALGKNWLVAKDWTEKARYATATHKKARKLFEAVTDPANGVMPWIRARW